MKANRKHSKHRDRMRELRKYALPPMGTRERDAIEEYLKEKYAKESNFVKQAETRYRQTIDFLSIQSESGLGFQMDKLLRGFLVEYNDRNFKLGLDSMPSSFNVIEGFLQYVPDYAHFRLKDEKDHLISFLEFFDYVTSTEDKLNSEAVTSLLDENIIYSYNNVSNLDEIVFPSDNDNVYALGGAAFVRHGSEISIILLCGEKQDVTELTRHMVDDVQFVKFPPSKKGLKPVGKHEAVPLLEDYNYWQTVVLTRIDLSDMTLDVRYVMKDEGNRYKILTDDVSVVLDSNGNFMDGINTRDMKMMADRVDEYSILFEICKTVLYLPLYFDTFGDEITVERYETILASRKPEEFPKGNPLLKPKHRVRFRNALVLNRQINPSPEIKIIPIPEIRINTSGFWKQLKPMQVGTDKHGRVIHGRTWVEQTLTWLESDHVPDNSLLANIKSGKVCTTNSGTIYIMRSAAHQTDVFKVGLTTREPETRATELSRTTGSPDKFLVVDSVPVSDCVLAEKLIHERLNQYRINPKREFFKAPLKVIIKAVYEVVNSMEQG